uniref:Gamma-glutamyltransferase n=1 Tax=Trichobilharzia regenti TaxID=157069 RepID=A0AA85INP0_TRIRE|nr:unnamed protein product [Trichobilharzia regenti]
MESKYAEKPQDIELTESEVTKTRPPYGDDNEYIVNKDTETILKDSSRKSSRKWRLEGVNIVVVSVIILSAAITIALILSIIFGEPQVAPHGAVVVDDDFCGEVGLNIMKIHKGNAIDAMVSTIVCLTVTRPDVASLGGCGAMMVRDRNKQTSHLFDFSCPARNNVADKDKPNRSNYASLVGIPALVRGLATMHKQFGSLKWSDLFNGAIDLATNGFKPSESLIKAANDPNLSISPELRPILKQLTSGVLPYISSIDLQMTLKQLAEKGVDYFYGVEGNTFNRQFVSYMNQQGFSWSINDSANYEVHRPTTLKMGFAGFTIESFPPPLVGGVYLLLLLGNLDLKESMNALNHEALLKADPYVTAIYLHRLVELSRLAEASVTTLGDIDDPKIRDTATNAQNSLFSKSSREASVTSIKDNNIVPEHSLLDVLKTTSEGSSIGSTGFVTTDSTSFTVVGNIYMGSPFGSGNIVPGTGVHLNSVLRLFSESKLNNFSAGRRPLVPIGPTYVTTTHRKCGIRVGVASSDGLWGLTDAAQVISNAALFLRNSKCQASIRTFGSPTTEFGIASSTVKEQTSTPLLGRAVFSPATENSCINPDISVSLSRLHPAYNPRNPGTITVETPDNNNPKLLKHLEGFGHPIQTLSTRQWPGRVFLAGWNGYDMIASGDPRSADSKTLHKY